MNDYYAILELSPDATQEQIKNQYFFLIQAWHPDKFPIADYKQKAEEKTKLINEAYGILKIPEKREQYDISRQDSRMQSSSEQPVTNNPQPGDNFPNNNQEKPSPADTATSSKQTDHQDKNVLVLKSSLQQVAMQFVFIPACSFWMGSDTSKDSYSYKDEMPRHKVLLDPYSIGKYCVTNRQYKVFVEATGYFQPILWEDGKIPRGKEDHPVVGVTWQDAINFCKWLSDKNGKQVRLPTEAEWENAARGPDGRRFPWRDKLPDPTLCNFNWSIGDTTPVGHYSPKGDGPYGCADQAGNVREFVADVYEENYYLESPAKNPRGPAIGTLKSLRGGSWCSLDTNCRSARRDVVGEFMFEIDIGFRCAIFS